MPRTLRTARRAPVALAALLAGSFALAACEKVTAPLEDPAATTYAPSLRVNLAEMTRTPSRLYIQDLAVGSGTVADSGYTITAYYAGWLTNGRQFDSNRNTGTPFGPIVLGTGQVIRGWDEGIKGMRVGGRRRLVVPPSLGYGGRTNGLIPAGSVLVFEIDLVSATAPATTPATTPATGS
jgi:peptidylprolyl isomerase